MNSATRLVAALFFAIVLVLATAGAALALDPPDKSPQDVCWNSEDFPGVGANSTTGNGKAWNAHFNSEMIGNRCP